MKRGGPEHPKTRRLAKHLNIPVAYAVGILECLFHFTAKYAKHGDVGRFDDAAIAEGCQWEGDPSTLVAGLTQCGWLDTHPSARLVVHDWAEHADEATRKAVARSGKPFVSGFVSTCRDNGGQRRTTSDIVGHCRTLSALEAESVCLPEPEPEPLPVPEPSPSAAAAAGASAVDDGEPFEPPSLPARRPPEPSALSDGVMSALTDWKGSRLNPASEDTRVLAKIRALCNGPPIGDVPVRSVIERAIRESAGKAAWVSDVYAAKVIANRVQEWRDHGIPDETTTGGTHRPAASGAGARTGPAAYHAKRAAAEYD